MLPWFVWLYLAFTSWLFVTVAIEDAQEGRSAPYVAAQIMQLAVIWLLTMSLWLPQIASAIGGKAWIFLLFLVGTWIWHSVEGFLVHLPNDPDLTPRRGVVIGIVVTMGYLLLISPALWASFQILT